MKYVIDSSTAFKWLMVEPDFSKARQLRDEYLRAVHELIAPDLFPTEMANGLIVAERRGRIGLGESVQLLRDLFKILPTLHPVWPDLLPRAHAIAAGSIASVYDSLYVALAEREGCELVTADDKLVRALRPTFPFITALASL
jgi:predicted nucleic acid-binding protein